MPSGGARCARRPRRSGTISTTARPGAEPHPVDRARPCAAVPGVDDRVGEEAVERDREERDQRDAAVARQRAPGLDVVERVADLAPREAAEGHPRDRRFREHPHRGGEERVRDAAAAEPTEHRARAPPSTCRARRRAGRSRSCRSTTTTTSATRSTPRPRRTRSRRSPAGRRPRQATKSGTNATQASGPRSSGGLAAASSTPVTAAAPRRAAVDRVTRSRGRSCLVSSASWCRGSTRKQLRHRNSFSRRGTIFVPPSPGSSGSSSSSSPSRPAATVRSRSTTSSASSTSSGWSSSSRSTTSSVFLFGLFDTTGSATGDHELALLRRDRGVDRRPRPTRSSSSVVVDELVVELLRDHVLVEVFLVELGLVLELVVAHRAGASLGREETCGWRPTAEPAKCFPMWRSGPVQALGGAEYNAALERSCDIARRPFGRERIGRTGPGDRWGRWVARAARGRRVIAAFSTEPPGQPPNPLGSPRPLAVSGEAHDRGRGCRGRRCSTPQRRHWCQAVARNDDQHRRASVQVNDTTDSSAKNS